MFSQLIDSINPIFQFKIIKNTKIYIYNRFGKLVTTLVYGGNGWDGTHNGQKMPSNDYWFLAEVQQNGEAFEVKGHFTLKR